jgi:DNA-binding transcriptional MerR regulator
LIAVSFEGGGESLEPSRNGTGKRFGVSESRLRLLEETRVLPEHRRDFSPEEHEAYELTLELVLAAKKGGLSMQRVRAALLARISMAEPGGSEGTKPLPPVYQEALRLTKEGLKMDRVLEGMEEIRERLARLEQRLGGGAG